MTEQDHPSEASEQDEDSAASNDEEVRRPTRASRQVVPAVIGALVLIAAGYLVFCWSLGQARVLYVVNGLDRPYTARIDGNDYRLEPFGIEKLRVREGTLRVEMIDANTSTTLPEETVSIRTEFLTRPIKRWTFVINPDRTAVLRRTRVLYVNRAGTTNPGRGREDVASEPLVTYVGADTLLALNDVDFPFNTPDESVVTRSRSKVVSRTMLSTVANAGSMTKAAMLALLVGKADDRLLKTVARQHILFLPDDGDYYALLQRVAKPEDRIEFLKPLLAKRPVIVAAHLAYQAAMQEAGKSAQLEKECAALSAATPGDRDLLYLHGRACTDWQAGLKLVEKAAGGDSPCSAACLYLSSWMLCNARFSEAADLARRAVKWPECRDKAQSLLLDALVFAGQYDEALKLADRVHANSLVDRTMSQIEILCAMGAFDRARDTATSAIQEMTRDLVGFVPERHGNLIMAYLESGAGNPEKFVKHARESGSPELELVAELTSGNLARAEWLAPDCATRNALRTRLLMFVVLSREGNTSDAQRQLKMAVAVLEQGDRTDRAMSAALSGKPVLPPDQLVTAQYDNPATKALLLTALGFVDVPNRDLYYSLARKLNSLGSLQYLLLKSVL